MVVHVYCEHVAWRSWLLGLTQAGSLRFTAYANIPPSMVYTEPVTVYVLQSAGTIFGEKLKPSKMGLKDGSSDGGLERRRPHMGF